MGKLRVVRRALATALPVVAEVGGVTVDALGGGYLAGQCAELCTEELGEGSEPAAETGVSANAL